MLSVDPRVSVLYETLSGEQSWDRVREAAEEARHRLAGSKASQMSRLERALLALTASVVDAPAIRSWVSPGRTVTLPSVFAGSEGPMNVDELVGSLALESLADHRLWPAARNVCAEMGVSFADAVVLGAATVFADADSMRHAVISTLRVDLMCGWSKVALLSTINPGLDVDAVSIPDVAVPMHLRDDLITGVGVEHAVAAHVAVAGLLGCAVSSCPLSDFGFDATAALAALEIGGVCRCPATDQVAVNMIDDCESLTVGEFADLVRFCMG